MRAHLPKKLEDGRVRRGKWASTSAAGPNGVFLIDGPAGRMLDIGAERGEGWEHVSVVGSDQKHTPTWDEMCFVKDLFWNEDECVVQYHPPISQYVKVHQHRLHLWRPTHQSLPMPSPKLAAYGLAAEHAR